ncbi:MAG: Na(+)/H(+) antiporter subunit B [Parvibaculaceae bacterium]|nr:Na(+)/H(+) antiporter subunit B [Parvibaculaceae bacterium]
MEHHLVLRVVSKLIIPPILLFGLYVQFHGDHGAGGGFQAGVIIAVAFILYGLVFGIPRLLRVLPWRFIRASMAAGVLLYAGTGAASMLMGADYLDYAPFGATPVEGQHLGILLVELGVGITVASVMLAIFIAFAARLPSQIKDEEW